MPWCFLLLTRSLAANVLRASAQYVSLHSGSAQHVLYGASGGVVEVEVGAPIVSLGPEGALVFGVGVYGA